ncbi:hypothetical protein [Lacticaseibacillus salsurivasis]|uniref:hypothetical protein n=1 Tax=Lacticaseibacillus salsurivasis TaxID=3081441 RepID=UPI0030C701CF
MENDDLFKIIKNNVETNRAYNPTQEEWLFCSINTAKALIVSTFPAHVTELSEWSSLTSVAEVKQRFDIVQGKYGSENFKLRHDNGYKKLCKIISSFPSEELSAKNKGVISEYIQFKKYFLYELTR